MSGRNKRDIYLELSYELKKDGRKYAALCLFCNKTLTNVASQRLKAHRNVCHQKGSDENVQIVYIDPKPANDENDNNKCTVSGTATQSILNDSCTEFIIDLDTSMNSVSSILPVEETSTHQAEKDSQNQTSDNFVESITATMIATDSSKLDPIISPSTSGLGITLESSSEENWQAIPLSSSSSPSPVLHDCGSQVFKVPKMRNEVSIKNQQGRTKGSQNKSFIKNYVDTLSKTDENEITEFLARFFYGCNIPFSVAESDHFKNLIKKLRPAYSDKIPSRKALSTTLLESEYQKQIKKGKSLIGLESVLLIDGWKNTASNSKNVVTMLHNSTGEQIFLNAWNLSGESETSERLAEIVVESIDQAKTLYNTSVYAVVSDNASTMIKMGKTVSIWHSNCSSHTANLLAKDILDKDLSSTVLTVLKEFRHPDLESSILEKGGTKIKIPVETRWCSHRDSFLCLIKNLNYMRQTVADPKYNKIKQNIKQIIFDDDFIENVRTHIKILDPICMLINESQKSKCSIADAANFWLSLEPPDNFQHHQDAYRKRKSMALNIYALSAYYLHPFYSNEKLNSEQVNAVNDFLLEILDADGIADWDFYNRRQGHFQLLYSKQLNDAYLFWRMANLKHPKLSKLAMQLLSIPASSAQIERVFSNWSYVHSDVRNRLTFDRSKKLVHIYHSLKITDTNKSEEY